MDNGYDSLVMNTDVKSEGNSLLRAEASVGSDSDLSSSSIGKNEDCSSVIELHIMENHVNSSDIGQENPSEADSEQNSHVPIEALADLENDSASLKIDEEEDESLAAESSIVENHLASSNIGPSFDSGNHSEETHVEASTHVSTGKEDLDGGGEMVSVFVESANSLPSEEETLPNGHHDNYNTVEEVALSSVPVELSALSLEEKASSFIQHGILDTAEGLFASSCNVFILIIMFAFCI